MEEKIILRNKMKALRKRLSCEEISDLSRKIAKNTVSHYEFSRAGDILIYMHYQSEVRTDGIMEHAWRLGKRVFVPRVKERCMDFFEICGPGECVPGYMGIPEPPAGAAPFVFKEGEKALMILPGLAFDKKGRRLGYGGGFYDRFLEKHPSCVKMGIGFDFQYIEEIPVNGQDIDMDFIITEKRTGEFL